MTYFVFEHPPRALHLTGALVEPAALRFFPVALNTVLDLLVPIRTQPYDGVFTQAYDK